MRFFGRSTQVLLATTAALTPPIATAAAAAAFVAVPQKTTTTTTLQEWGQLLQQHQRSLSTTTTKTASCCLFSAVARTTTAPEGANAAKEEKGAAAAAAGVVPPSPARKSGRLSGEEISARLAAQLEKLKLKDQTSPRLSKEELKIVYEDEHIVVVDKPAGVLTVAGKDKSNNSLAQAVFDNLVPATKNKKAQQLENADRMVVHRLGMDTSGLIVLAKSVDAVRGLNAAFRTRAVERTYEALVVGHVQKDRGLIDLPLMRDYERPPYVRISTDEHQEALVDLDPAVVGKKLLEAPKEALTKYEVVAREERNGQPVTRVKLTSISGRTHQLNCHLAALGHAIVGDTTYGLGGDAAPNGGLTDDEILDLLPPNPARVDSVEQQQQAANSAVGDATATKACCHAAAISFRHPVTKKQISLTSESPF